MTATGRLLVVEGLDGSGKTTLSRRLAEHLGGRWFTTPDSDLRALRQDVEEALRNPDARQLFYAASVVEVAARARAVLARGQDVIVDRYWLSTWAYGAERGTSLVLSEIEASLLPADLTVFLTAPRELRAQRMAARQKMTAADQRSLDPANEARLLARYRSGLQRPIAGTWVEIDTFTRDEDESLARVLRSLEVPACEAPRASGIQPCSGLAVDACWGRPGALLPR